MRKYFDLEVKENDVIDGRTLSEKLVIPKDFKKQLNSIEIGHLLDAQLLENNLALDSKTILFGNRVIEASENLKKNFKLINPNYSSKRLLEYIDKFNKEFGVPIFQLQNLSFNEGEKILLAAGYKATESEESDSTIADYIIDFYYTLFDEEGETLDIKSFVQHKNKNSNEYNDDGGMDFVVKEGWEQA